MDTPNTESRVEAQLKALNETVGNYFESHRASESSSSKELRDLIENSVHHQVELGVGKLTEYIGNAILSADGPIQTYLRDSNSSNVGRFDQMETQLKAIQADISKLEKFHTPKSSPSSSVLVGSDTESETKTKELKARLVKAEFERDRTQTLYEKVRSDLNGWKAEFEAAQEAHEILEGMQRREIEEEQKRNRLLFETIQEMKGNIRVMARIRPAPIDTPEEELINFGPKLKGELTTKWAKMRMPVERKNAIGNIVTETKSFDFERIFAPEESNDDIFNEISDLTELAFQGQKVGIFAYGQTGSGKTYTLSNKGTEENSSDDGIIPKTLSLMFNVANSTSNRFETTVSLSVLEIYVDNIYDLLQAPNKGEKVQTRLEQATVVTLESLAKAETIIDDAINIRASGATNKNATSSRSHLILTFQITRRDLNGQVDTGIINLVDLAGSERSAAGGLEGQQLKEGIKINNALLSLNRAITALGSGAAVPYDTALTRALRPVLSAGSKTLMFVMISPLKRDLSISLQTLDKGQEATNAKLASNTSTSKVTRPSSLPAPSRGSKIPTTPTTRKPVPQSNVPRGGTPQGGVSRGGASRGVSSRLPGMARGTSSTPKSRQDTPSARGGSR
ncbi:P-loop containing nucleoside triphosphate hydrolase protein [Hypoxylon fuscum]|nr:P-loop containing nucleoside triphosphate hydrolase protein [Hypoxylon fuscum]